MVHRAARVGGDRRKVMVDGGLATRSSGAGVAIASAAAARPSTGAITVVLGEDHLVVRQGLRSVLSTQPDLVVVGDAADGLELIDLASRVRPQVVVTDLVMPVLGGLDVTREVRRRFPRTGVVILTAHGDYAYVQAALAAGASAYVLKEASALDLAHAIRAARSGTRLLCPPLSEEALEAYVRRVEPSSGDAYDALTARERQVLQLAADGHANTAIADRLNIGVRTVESHRANLMRKLGLRDRGDVIRYALARGLVAVSHRYALPEAEPKS